MSAGFADRKAMLAKVHIAKKELRLDDVAYGEVLERVTGEASSKSLTRPQLDRVLLEFKRLGWKPAEPRVSKSRSQKPAVRMIYAVWRDLVPYLGVSGEEAVREALRSFVRRQTRSRVHPEGVAAPEFLDSKQANLVLEGLKAWRTRAQRERPAGAAEAAAGAAGEAVHVE